MLLAGILNGDTETNIEPGSRKEMYLKAILENGGGGGGGGGLPDVTDADNGDFARVVNGAWGKDAGDDIARTDGYYETMGVGSADQLIATSAVADKEPYYFRTSGGSADVGDRKRVKKIVGGTYFWNQLVDGNTGFAGNHATISYNSSAREYTITFDQSGNGNGMHNATVMANVPEGHVVLVTFEAKGSTDFPFHIKAGGTDTGYVYEAATSYQRVWAILTTTTTGAGFNCYAKFVTEGDVMYVRNLQIYDLTAMMPDVADHIAALETSDTGAGVAYFRKLFPNDFYLYATDTYSVLPKSCISVGFNAFNVEDGIAFLIGGHEYQITGVYTALVLHYYDGGQETISPYVDGKFTPTKSGYLYVTGGDSTTCVHLVWSGYRDGDFEEYKERVYTLDDELTLRGIPKLAPGGNLYYDGDTYEPDGTVTRRFYEVSSADCTVGTYAGTRWRLALPSSAPDMVAVSTSQVVNARCKYFTATYKNAISDASKFKIAQSDNATYKTRHLMFTIDSTSVTTEADAALWISNHPFRLIYECAATTETAEPYTETQLIDDFGIEVLDTYQQGGVYIPVGHETEYPANLRDKLQHLPSLASEDGWYVVQQSGQQMYLRSVSEVTVPLLVGLEYDATDDRYAASYTNGEIADALILGRRVFLDFEIPSYTGWRYLAEVCVGGTMFDNARVTAFFAQMVDPFSGALVSLYSSPSTDDSKSWHMQTYPLTGA